MLKVRHFLFTRGHLKWLRDKKIRCEKIEHDRKENPDGLGFGDNFLDTTMA